MKTSKVINLVFILLLTSCSFFKRKDVKAESGKVKSSHTYTLSDKSGEFEYTHQSNYVKKNNRIITKYQVKARDAEAKVLEQAVIFSNPGKVKDVSLSRPEISQYSVWFEGKKYFTEIKFNPKMKTLDFKLESPEKQWNGTKSLPLPKNAILMCFLGQIMECAKQTGFIDKSIKAQTGTMNFYLIIEGYPYFQEQYLGIEDSPLISAQLTYDGTNQQREKRYSLNFSGQSIFYFLNEKQEMIKKFWVSQGLTVN